MSYDSSALPKALAAAATTVALAVVAASLLEGPPEPLPGVALGWPVILYAERAGLALLFVAGLGGVVGELSRGGRVSSAGGGPLPAVDLDLADGVKGAAGADITALERRLDTVETRIKQMDNEGSAPPEGVTRCR